MRTQRPLSNFAHLGALTLVLALSGLSQGARAADMPPIKPGLWEVISDSQTVNGKAMPNMSGQLAERMKSLPPEMRARMEAQMKAKGVMIGQGDGGGMAVRMCITKEMLEKNHWQKPAAHCENTGMSHSGSTWTWQFKCTQPPSEGEGSTTFTSAEAYNSDVHIKSMRNGKANNISMKHHAKWLGADCGGLQPVSPPAKP